MTIRDDFTDNTETAVVHAAHHNDVAAGVNELTTLVGALSSAVTTLQQQVGGGTPGAEFVLGAVETGTSSGSTYTELTHNLTVDSVVTVKRARVRIGYAPIEVSFFIGNTLLGTQTSQNGIPHVQFDFEHVLQPGTWIVTIVQTQASQVFYTSAPSPVTVVGNTFTATLGPWNAFSTLRIPMELTFQEPAEVTGPSTLADVFKGTWTAEGDYTRGDLVKHNGGLYLALATPQDPNAPDAVGVTEELAGTGGTNNPGEIGAEGAFRFRVTSEITVSQIVLDQATVSAYAARDGDRVGIATNRNLTSWLSYDEMSATDAASATLTADLASPVTLVPGTDYWLITQVRAVKLTQPSTNRLAGNFLSELYFGPDLTSGPLNYNPKGVSLRGPAASDTWVALA